MDPYTELLECMRSEGAKYNPPSIQIGEMVNDNTLKLGDLQIDKDNLYFADYLLKDYTRAYATSSDKATWSDTRYIKTVDTLKAGDLVAVMPTIDTQMYIILCKVVKL